MIVLPASYGHTMEVDAQAGGPVPSVKADGEKDIEKGTFNPAGNGWASVTGTAFDPERWLKDGEFDSGAGPSLPFSVGLRSCFGKKLAVSSEPLNCISISTYRRIQTQLHCGCWYEMSVGNGRLMTSCSSCAWSLHTLRSPFSLRRSRIGSIRRIPTRSWQRTRSRHLCGWRSGRLYGLYRGAERRLE